MRFSTEMREMPAAMCKRHAEATQCIQTAYRFAAANQTWPDEDQFQNLAVESCLPPEWGYASNAPSEGGAVLCLSGPFHSTLYYRFPSSISTEPSKQWCLNIEGSNRFFETDVEYRSPHVE